MRTSDAMERLSSEDAVHRYKSLSQVELAFRCLKGIDPLVRAIRHRSEDRLPVHVSLRMRAHYVERYMRSVLAPDLFGHEELEKDRRHRDPILPAKPS
jgi:transposase